MKPIHHLYRHNPALAATAGSLRVAITLALIGLLSHSAHAANKTWIGGSGGTYNTAGNWSPSGLPNQFDNAIFNVGPVTPPYIVWLLGGTFFNPSHVDFTVDRLVIAGNPLTFTGLAGSTLTADSTATDEINRGLMIGQSGHGGTSTAVMNSSLASLSVVYATLGVSDGTSGTLNVNTGTFNVTGTGATYDFIVGRNGVGVININNGADANISGDTALAKNSDLSATGIINVTGAGSTWTSGGNLYIGEGSGFGTGTLNVTASGRVSDTDGYVGASVNATGSATVSGAGSTWTCSNSLYVGYFGNGTLNLTSGGDVVSPNVYVGYNDGSIGEVNVSTVGGGNLTRLAQSGELFIGYNGTGSLNVTDGGYVQNTNGYVGHNALGDGGTTVSGVNSKWNNTANLIVGNAGNGTLEILAGGAVNNVIGYIGNQSDSTGTVTVEGMASTWTNGGDLYVGNAGSGTLDIATGGRVSNVNGYIGNGAGSTGDVTVDGANSAWNMTGNLYVGNAGIGTLNIVGGGQVSNATGYIGDNAGSNGTVAVEGVDSKWINEDGLIIAFRGDGNLDISGGGSVFSEALFMGFFPGATGIIRVDETSMLTCHSMTIGDEGQGTLEVTNGGTARVTSQGTLWTEIGRLAGSSGRVHVDGIGSQWLLETERLNVGTEGHGQLDITNGATVVAQVTFVGEDFGGIGAINIVGSTSSLRTVGLSIGQVGSGIVSLANGGKISSGSDVFVGLNGEVRGDGEISFTSPLLRNLINDGLISPGASAGVMKIDGNYTQRADGELLIELASASSFDQLLVTEDIALAGTLTVNLLNSFIPSPGQSFTILTADDVDGMFTSEMVPSVPGLIFDVIYNPQSVVLMVTSAAVPGDYNFDGTIDAADYIVWRKNDGTQAGYDTWRAHFGPTVARASGANANAAVPEPATLMLLLISCAAMGRLKSRQI